MQFELNSRVTLVKMKSFQSFFFFFFLTHTPAIKAVPHWEIHSRWVIFSALPFPLLTSLWVKSLWDSGWVASLPWGLGKAILGFLTQFSKRHPWCLRWYIWGNFLWWRGWRRSAGNDWLNGDVITCSKSCRLKLIALSLCPWSGLIGTAPGRMMQRLFNAWAFSLRKRTDISAGETVHSCLRRQALHENNSLFSNFFSIYGKETFEKYCH